MWRDCGNLLAKELINLSGEDYLIQDGNPIGKRLFYSYYKTGSSGVDVAITPF